MKTYLVAAAALSLLGATAASAQDQRQDQRQDNPQAGHEQHGGGQWQGHGGGQPQGQPAQGGQGRSAPPQGQPAQGAGRPGGQAGQRPDWGAYMRNNPDVARAYRNNQAQGGHETADQFAERHYRQAGQHEGRALPETSAPASQVQQGQWQGRDQGQRAQGGDRTRGPDQNRWGNDQRRDNWNSDGRRWDNRGDNRAQADRDHRAWNGRVWQGRDYRRNVEAHRRFRAGGYARPSGWYYQRWTYGQVLPSLFWAQNFWIDNFGAYDLPPPPPGTVWVRYGPDALLVDRWSGEIVEAIYGLFY